MDKPRDVRRGASRFSTATLRIKQSGHKLCGGLDGIRGEFEFSEKSKKEKVRSLSAVARALSSYENQEMGCDITEKVDALPARSLSSSITAASKRFKIPKKFFDDCNGVDHASVPRKLRSAMKKRNREYISPDSEMANHKLNRIESPEKDGIKKTKVNIKQESPDWSPRQTVSPITKDEEEVVETLYALAGMFPCNGSTDRGQLDDDSLPENSSVLQDIEESVSAAFEASGTAQDASPSCAERSPGEASKIISLNETDGKKQPDLLENAKFSMASDSFTPKMNVQTMPMLIRSENGNEVALNDSELHLAVGLNMPRQPLISHIERKPKMAVKTARTVECKQEHHTIKDPKKNGPTLWPGLSLVASTGSHASYLQSSAAKAPVWLDAATCASKHHLMQTGSSGSKISDVVIHKKSWKRCAAHVHISNFIHSLQVPNSKDMLLQQPNQSNQMRANEGPTHGILMDNLNRVKNEITSLPITGHSDPGNDSHETRNDILRQQRSYHDISQAAPTPEVYGPQKQGFDLLLSLSAGGNGLKVNNNFDKGENRMEPLSKLQVPYFQPLSQQHGLMRYPMPQSQYASPSYHDQISVAGQQVLPHYYGSPLWGTRNSSTASNKQQQQSFWAVQVAAQGRSTVNCNIMRTQYPNWQSGRQDTPVVSPCAQAIFPHSPASLEVLGPKFTPISEQQQQLITLASSLPPSRTNGLDFHLPSVCEESRGRFRSRGTPSLQLLCDERI